jgi:ferric-dicitrate binding protein FerR (iron transport regulator)
MSQERFSILIAKALSHEASLEEVAELHGLVEKKPEWKDAFGNLQELLTSRPVSALPRSTTEEAYLLHLGRLKDQVNDFDVKAEESIAHEDEDFQLYPVIRPFYKRWQVYAAVLIPLAILAFSFKFLGGNDTNTVSTYKHINEINVNPGAKTKIQLPDGSQVWVNSDSKLSYPETFKGSVREVFLEGEAYFDVVKDPFHPFIVHTSGIDIKVLGTAFNVKAYDAEPTIEATLIHGMIEVGKTNQPDAPKVILKPHEKLIFNKLANKLTDEANTAKVQRISSATPLMNIITPAITIAPLAKNIADTAIVETSWIYNRLMFEDEKFEDLAIKMERWFNVKIVIATDRIKSYTISGSFENETIEEALKELQYLVPFSYQIDGRDIYINKK